MLVSYDYLFFNLKSKILYCRVTRMLVSYDLIFGLSHVLVLYCRVTRMLVSYDANSSFTVSSLEIAGSPECW